MLDWFIEKHITRLRWSPGNENDRIISSEKMCLILTDHGEKLENWHYSVVDWDELLVRSLLMTELYCDQRYYIKSIFLEKPVFRVSSRNRVSRKRWFWLLLLSCRCAVSTACRCGLVITCLSGREVRKLNPTMGNAFYCKKPLAAHRYCSAEVNSAFCPASGVGWRTMVCCNWQIANLVLVSSVLAYLISPLSTAWRSL